MEGISDTGSMHIHHTSQKQSSHANQDTEIVETKRISMSFNNSESNQSALQLVYSIRPDWETSPGSIDVHRFTAGVMNTLLKVTKRVPGASDEENDRESILLRAYGADSDILVDRDMEAATHALLSQRGLAAPLLARFDNGLLYKYQPGRICTAEDLGKEDIWRAVAARLGEWHARLPLPTPKKHSFEETGAERPNSNRVEATQAKSIGSRFPSPNIWSVMQQWVHALPARTEAEKTHRGVLQNELQRSFEELDHDHGLGYSGFILGHCDLLSANVIVPPEDQAGPHGSRSWGKSLMGRVSFIDYEYAVPCPAAFDIANHFSEWAGYQCNYSLLPTEATRRSFVREYLQSYSQYAPLESSTIDARLEDLLVDIDRYRGIPGFYWGCQGLIQAVISDNDFDWSSYAALRMAEYWAWRGETDGTRAAGQRNMPLRERRWTQTV